jgi:hypothetical protein
VTQPPPAPLGHQTKNQPVPNDDIEEGELSEGQFEDLYEPREAIEPNKAQRDHSKHLPTTVDPSQPTSAVATPEAGFYGNDDDEGPAAAVKDGVAAVDGMYSYDSPGVEQSRANKDRPRTIGILFTFPLPTGDTHRKYNTTRRSRK